MIMSVRYIASLLLILSIEPILGFQENPNEKPDENPNEDKPNEKLLEYSTTYPPSEDNLGTQEPKEIIVPTTISSDVVLAEGRVPTVPGQLVKCRCGAKEVMTKDGCQPHHQPTYIYAENEYFRSVLTAVDQLNVVVHEPTCRTKEGHRELTYNSDQFVLRMRGDLVLRGSVGVLEGLRINDYCIEHYRDDGGEVTWRLVKACVSPPSVPRCCPVGEVMREGSCRPDPSSPVVLAPPIHADIFGDPVSWPVVENHIYPLNCTEDPMISLPLESKVSYLLSVPTGMVYIWDPALTYINKLYSYPHDFCIDGRILPDNSLEYSAKICYMNPMEKHTNMCQGPHICIRKCCEFGQVMNDKLYRCMDFDNTFNPPFNVTPPEYKTVIGKPLCAPSTLQTNFSIDTKGNLHADNRVIPPTNYCTDKFTSDQDNVDVRALACISSNNPMVEFRSVVLPVSHMISLVFLLLTVLCYCLVSRITGGLLFFFYVTSLMCSYITSLLQHFFGESSNERTCMAMAFTMQFSYLCTFFFLTCMVFNVWRNVRKLVSLECPPSIRPLFRYLLVGFGGPCVILVVTVCMQFLAPDGVPWVVKPGVGRSRCWFSGNLETFLYFYGPISILLGLNLLFLALTLCHYRHLKSVERKTVERRVSVDQDSNLGERNRVDRANEVMTPLTVNQPCLGIHHYLAESKQQLVLLALITLCYTTEVLSWKIPPPEMWILTDILNTLQGVFAFLFVFLNKTTRQHFMRKCPKVSSAVNKLRRSSTKDKEIMKNP